MAEKTYLVLNPNTSDVIVSTRGENFCIQRGSDDSPTAYPMTLDEIRYINNTTKVFKIGVLWFEEEEQEELYQALRLHNWKDILTNGQIEDMILHPTVEKLERVLAIEDSAYFGRIYGVFVGLRNAGANISSNVVNLMTMRFREMANQKRKTGIVLTKGDVDESGAADALRLENKALRESLAEMQAMLQHLVSNQEEQGAVTAPEKKTRRRTTAKKVSGESEV